MLSYILWIAFQLQCADRFPTDMNTYMISAMFRQDAVEATLCADVPRLSYGVNGWLGTRV